MLRGDLSRGFGRCSPCLFVFSFFPPHQKKTGFFPLVASITCANVKTFWLFCVLSNLFSLHKLDVQGDGHLAAGENAADFDIDCSGHLVELPVATSRCKPSAKEREVPLHCQYPRGRPVTDGTQKQSDRTSDAEGFTLASKR